MPVELNTITWGEGPKSALLLHGITASAAGWWRLGPAVANLGYTAVAADMRGHGLSPKSDDYRFTSHAQDVLELGERWDVVIGHSMGAAVSLIAQAVRPSWASKLILEEPALLLPDLEFASHWILQDFGSDTTVESLLVAHPEWDRDDAVHKLQAMDQCGRQLVEQTLEQNDPWDVRELVPKVEVPTLLVGADPELGGVLPPSYGEHLANEITAVAFRQVMGSHSMHRDRWEEFWAVVSDFL